MKKVLEKILNYNRVILLRIAILIILASVGFILFISLGQKNYYDSMESVFLDVKWMLETDNNFLSEETELPYSFERNTVGEYRFSTIIPETEFRNPMLIFTVFFKDVWVYIDNELVFEHVFQPSALNPNNAGSGEVRIIMPSDCAGKRLEIKYNSIPCTEVTYFSKPEIRDTSERVFSLTVVEISILFIVLAFIFISIFLMIIYCTNLTSMFDRLAYLYLALFFLSISLWSICYTRLIELCIYNWSFSFHLEYLSLYAIPMFLWFLYEKIRNQKDKLIGFMKVLSVCFYAVVIFSYLLFHVSFTFYLTTFHIFALFTVIMITYELIKNFKGQSMSYKLFASAIGCVFLSGIVGIKQFYQIPGNSPTGLIMIVMLAISGILLIMSIFVQSNEVIKSQFNKVMSENQEIEYMRYENIFNNSGYVFFDWNTIKDTAYISNNFEEFFGAPINIKKFSESLISVAPCLSIDNQFLNVVEKLKNKSNHEKIEGVFVYKNTEDKYFSMDLTSNYDSNGNKNHVMGMIKDTTETIKLEEEHFRQMQYIDINRQLYDSVLEADIENDLLIGLETEKFAIYLGMGEDRSYSRAIKIITEKLTHPDFIDMYLETFSRERILSLFEEGINSFQAETYELSSEGNYEWFQLNVLIYKSKNLNSVCIVSYVQNISKMKQRELELVESSTKDFLSKLLNKGTSMRLINQILTMSNIEKDAHALILIDIDEFKGINDTLGHATGDKVIGEVAKKLATLFRKEDIIGRFGGDEFVVLVKNTNDINILQEKCKELNREICMSYGNGNKRKQISLSIGLACYPKHGIDYETLFTNADKAMYQSKQNGRNTYTIYEDKFKNNKE